MTPSKSPGENIEITTFSQAKVAIEEIKKKKTLNMADLNMFANVVNFLFEKNLSRPDLSGNQITRLLGIRDCPSVEEFSKLGQKDGLCDFLVEVCNKIEKYEKYPPPIKPRTSDEQINSPPIMRVAPSSDIGTISTHESDTQTLIRIISEDRGLITQIIDTQKKRLGDEYRSDLAHIYQFLDQLDSILTSTQSDHNFLDRQDWIKWYLTTLHPVLERIQMGESPDLKPLLPAITSTGTEETITTLSGKKEKARVVATLANKDSKSPAPDIPGEKESTATVTITLPEPPTFSDGGKHLLVMGIYEREGIADSLREWFNKREAMPDGLARQLTAEDGHVFAEVEGNGAERRFRVFVGKDTRFIVAAFIIPTEDLSSLKDAEGAGWWPKDDDGKPRFVPASPRSDAQIKIEKKGMAAYQQDLKRIEDEKKKEEDIKKENEKKRIGLLFPLNSTVDDTAKLHKNGILIEPIAPNERWDNVFSIGVKGKNVVLNKVGEELNLVGIGFNKEGISFTVKLIEGTTISYGTMDAQTTINPGESFTLTNGAFLTLGSYKFRFEEKPFEDVRQQTGITLTLKPEEKPTFEEISGLAGDNTATINTQVTFTSKVKTTQNIECQWEIYKEVQADGKVSWQAINAVTAFPQPLNNALTGIQPFQWVFDTLGRYLIKIQYKLPTAKVFSEGVQKLFIVKPHEPAPAQAPATTGMQLHQQQPPYGATPPFYLQGGYPPPGLGMGSTVVIIGHPTDGMRIVQGSSVYPLGQIHNATQGTGAVWIQYSFKGDKWEPYPIGLRYTKGVSSNAFEVTSQNPLKTDVPGRQILVLRAQLEGMRPIEERVSFEVIPQPAPEPLQVQFGGINPIEGEKGTQLQLTGYVRTNKPVYYQWVKWKVMADGNIDKSGDYLSGVFFESPTGEKYNPIKILHTFQDTGRFRIFIYHGVEPGKLILKSPIGDIEIKDSSKGRGVPNLHASTLQPQPNQPIPQGFSSAITQPSQDVELMEAQTIEFVGKVTGGVPPFRIWWRNYGTPYSDGKTISENPPMQELNNAGETRISFKFSEKGVYRITLYVTDSENKKNSSERKVDFSLNPF